MSTATRILEGQSFQEGVFSSHNSLRMLASAVLEEAWHCAESYRPSENKIWKECIDSRYFLLGEGKAWRESLEYWCDLANLYADRIIAQAKKTEWYKDHLEKMELLKKKKLIIVADFKKKVNLAPYIVLRSFVYKDQKLETGSIFTCEDPRIIKDLINEKCIKRHFVRKETERKETDNG